MKREAVAYVAAFAAAVSVAALGYAVVWGIDLSEPVVKPAAPQQAAKVKPARRVPPVVLTPVQPGDDAKRAATAPKVISAAGDAAQSAAISPRDGVSDLPQRPVTMVFAPPLPADGARHQRAESARPRVAGDPLSTVVAQSAPDAVSSLGPAAALPMPPTAGDDARPRSATSARLTGWAAEVGHAIVVAACSSALMPETGEPAVEAPALTPDPDPTSTVTPSPPADHGHVVTVPRKREGTPAGTEGARAPVIVRPRSVLLPARAPVMPPVRRAPERAVAPPAPSALPPLLQPPPGVTVMRGVPDVPIDPPGIVVVRGAPPMPDAAYGRPPGPLIIELPVSRRR